jgi:hypothetical protein
VTQDREQPFSIDRTWTSDPDASPSPSQDVDKPIVNCNRFQPLRAIDEAEAGGLTTEC